MTGWEQQDTMVGVYTCGLDVWEALDICDGFIWLSCETGVWEMGPYRHCASHRMYRR